MQIFLMSQADIVFGMHGAAFTNVMFMYPCSGLIEIFSPAAVKEYYKFMAKKAQLEYIGYSKSIVDKSTPLPKDKRNYNLIVDLATFQQAFSSLLEAVKEKKYRVV